MFFNSINIYASESDLSLEIPVSIILKGNAPENVFRYCCVCGKNETRGENNYETNRNADVELADGTGYVYDHATGYGICGRRRSEFG